MVIATRYQGVEVYSRTSQGWTNYHAYGPHEEVELSSLGIRFPLAALYRNSGVHEVLDNGEGEV